MSVYLYGALWIGGICLVAAVLLFIAYRIGDPEHRNGNNDVNGLIFAIVGVLFAIVLGFVVTSQWDNVGNAQAAAQQESDGLLQVYWTSESLPAAQRAQIRSLCQEYALTVHDTEWPAMAHGRPVGNKGQQVLDRLNTTVHSSAAIPDTPAGQLNDALSNVAQGRQQRLSLAHQSLSGLMWFVMIAGGLLTSALAYLFGVPSRTAHLFMIVSLVGTITLLLYACYQLQFPYGPATDLQPTGMTSALRVFGVVL